MYMGVVRGGMKSAARGKGGHEREGLTDLTNMD